MYFLNEPVFCEKIKGKNGLIYVISSSDFQTPSMVLIFFALAFLIINKTPACSGVHSACRREEMCTTQSTTPSTAHTGADAGTSWSYGGGGGS